MLYANRVVLGEWTLVDLEAFHFWLLLEWDLGEQGRCCSRGEQTSNEELHGWQVYPDGLTIGARHEMKTPEYN